MGILIFKVLIARRLYKSFGVKELHSYGVLDWENSNIYSALGTQKLTVYGVCIKLRFALLST
jgi:hypothetical protein